MSSFHPAKINKLQPVKHSAASILKKAHAWQAGSVPAGNGTAAVKPLLRALLSQCQTIYDAAAANKPALTPRPLVMKAHNTFNAIIVKTK